MGAATTDVFFEPNMSFSLPEEAGAPRIIRGRVGVDRGRSGAER